MSCNFKKIDACETPAKPLGEIGYQERRRRRHKVCPASVIACLLGEIFAQNIYDLTVQTGGPNKAALHTSALVSSIGPALIPSMGVLT